MKISNARDMLDKKIDTSDPKKIGPAAKKIISEENARKLKPDYFFVMPYGFINEFLIREKNWLKNGGKFLLPYPKLKVVK